MFRQLWRKFKNSEWEEDQANVPTNQSKKILIVGAGMVGLTSAYYLSKFGNYEVTIVEKDYPIKGASEQNANTIWIDMLPVFSSMNYLNVIKENLMFKENPTSYLRFRLIFESDFRYWLKHFIKCRSKERIERSTDAVVKLSSMGFKLYDDFVLDITDNRPDLVDYHQEVFSKIFKNFSPQDIAIKEKVVEITSKYDSGWKKFGREILRI